MARATAAAPIVVDTKALSRLARDLRRSAPDVYARYRVRAKTAMEVVASDAKSRASFSDRIPGTIGTRMTAAGNVKAFAGGPAAPDAAPIDNRGKGFVRHPVFGNRDVWTAKNSHPSFLGAAFDAHREEVMDQIEAAITDAVSEAINGRGT